MPPITRGAYGFRLNYADPGEHLDDLVHLGDSEPEVTVSWRHASTLADVEEVDEERVVYGIRGATTFRVERDPASIVIDVPFPPVPGALVHPLLTIAISILARWRGDVTLHAGAFETPAGAWGVMGVREAGKSAMLAAVSRRGLPIVADDLLTIEDGSVWAGPDCVDLRPDTAERFGARYLGIVGGRPRFRLSTPPSRPRVPFRGFFILDWHDRPEIEAEPLPTRERLRWLYRQEYIPLVGFSDPRELLSLLPAPAWRLSRPQDWTATETTVDRVLEVVEEAS
ncbi:MAG: hypothetical protein KY397_01520 [Gemmatimonadetes bacterium]|nr:hypothetical protein [Gemmatimonadota bacterium]